jgi:hydroxyacylglutathione hydrolase
MKRDIRLGPKLVPSLPAPAPLGAGDVEALDRRRDIVVLDTRTRNAFFEGHLDGSILAELDYQFCTVAGSYVAERTPLYLVVETARLDEAVRALVRVGLDRVDGYLTPDTLAEYVRAGGVLARTDVIDMPQLESRRLRGSVRILDVRGKAEFDTGHVPGAINIAHTRVGLRLDELPKDAPILVHCNSGARSAAAVSLLVRHGYEAVQVNDLIANYRQSQLQASEIA